MFASLSSEHAVNAIVSELYKVPIESRVIGKYLPIGENEEIIWLQHVSYSNSMLLKFKQDYSMNFIVKSIIPKFPDMRKHFAVPAGTQNLTAVYTYYIEPNYTKISTIANVLENHSLNNSFIAQVCYTVYFKMKSFYHSKNLFHGNISYTCVSDMFFIDFIPFPKFIPAIKPSFTDHLPPVCIFS